ncbi:MAG: hypothetical protein U5K72_19080 [Balneolaceae bacterium]|nr:hypothetical protein [Balneolaceae bacterium]
MKTLRTLKNNTAILRTLILTLFFLGLIFSLSANSTAGSPQNEPANRIALSIDRSDNTSLTTEQFNQIREIGIDMLEISFPASIRRSDLEQFYLLLDSNQHFVTEYEAKNNRELLVNSIQTMYSLVPNQLRDNIAAIKVFNYPADYRSAFPASSDSLLTDLFTSIEKPFYYQSAFSEPEFPVQQVDFFASRVRVQPDSLITASSTVILFEPENDPVASLQTLETIFKQTATQPESLVIIPADWFLSRVESQASFSTIISSYLDGESVHFPMPEPSPDSPAPNWPIILLLLIWASYLLHYKYQPMYKATLPRYFFYHSFFIHDVQQHRIRNTTPGVIVLLQHTLITGFFFYLLSDSFISNMGLESLSYHYPALFYSGFEKVSIFVIGLLIAFISHILSVAWLYLPNKKLEQLNQVINLYSWPFHINLIVVTFAVYFIQIEAAQSWTIATAILYFFFWFAGFIFAAADSARFLQKYRVLNLFLTVGLYFLLITAIIVLALWLPMIYQPIEMAFMLP